MYHAGQFPRYEKFFEELKNMPENVVEIYRKADKKAAEYARAYQDEPIQYLVDVYKRQVSWLEEKYGKAVGKGYDRPDQYAVQNWIISVQGQMISGVTECFAGNYESIMEGTYTRDLFAGTDVELLMEALGGIALRYAFLSLIHI